MPLRREKHLLPTILYSRVTLIIVIGLCVFLALSVYERYTIEREMADRRVNAELELELLKERKDELTKKVDYLSAEYGIEAEIRKHFDVARKGEQVVIIIDDEDTVASVSTGGTNETEDGHGFWSWLIPW